MKNFLKKLILILIFCSVFFGFYFIAKIIENIQNSEVNLTELLLKRHESPAIVDRGSLTNHKASTPTKSAQPGNGSSLDGNNQILKAFFSPDDNLKAILIELIKSEQKEIDVAIYTITEKDISAALVEAKKRGILVNMVVDSNYGFDRYSKVSYLANNKIPIWVYQSSDDPKLGSIMHNKFCIFYKNIKDRTLLWTGSYNFTSKASYRNQENVIILDNSECINRFINQFNILKSRSMLINGKQESIIVKNSEKKSESYFDPIIKLLGLE